MCRDHTKLVFKLKNMYHPVIKNPIKNNINMRKNIIITGPNASGKTTILKTTLINILLAQQIGCGFHKGGYITPFDFIHCYLK